MKKKDIILPLILALTLTSGLEIAYAGDSAIIEVSAENIYLTAGQENAITVRLKNTGDYKVFDIETFLSSSTENINVLTKANNVINEIKPNKYESYKATVYVDQDTPIGAYNLLLVVNYGRSGTISSRQISVPIGVIVWESYKPKLGFTADQQNLKIKSGTEKEIELSFKNQWNREIQNLFFVINSDSTGITVIDQVSETYETLNVSESIIISPRVSALEGIRLDTYSLSVSAMYNDEDGNAYNQRFNVPILVDEAEALPKTIVTISEAQTLQEIIRPGDSFDLQLTFTCSKADAYDLISMLSISQTPQISPIGPTIVSLGNLPKQETTQINYRLLVNGDAPAGQYPITVSLSYTDSTGVDRTLSETITILVDGLIEFQLLDTPTSLILQSDSQEIEADILLIGTENVQFVSIALIENEVFERVPGSEEYIGAIDPDSPIPFDIRYKINEDTEPGLHTMNLLVIYRDHLNRAHETTLDLDLELSLGNDQENNQENKGGFWQWLRNLFR